MKLLWMLEALLLWRIKRETRHYCQKLDMASTGKWSYSQEEWLKINYAENLVIIFGRPSPNIIGS